MTNFQGSGFNAIPFFGRSQLPAKEVTTYRSTYRREEGANYVKSVWSFISWATLYALQWGTTMESDAEMQSLLEKASKFG